MTAVQPGRVPHHRESPPNQQHTLNKLPTEFRHRNFVNKHRLSIQISAKRAITCMQCVHIPTELPFCMPPLLVGDPFSFSWQLFPTARLRLPSRAVGRLQDDFRWGFIYLHGQGYQNAKRHAEKEVRKYAS